MHRGGYDADCYKTEHYKFRKLRGKKERKRCNHKKKAHAEERYLRVGNGDICMYDVECDKTEH